MDFWYEPCKDIISFHINFVGLGAEIVVKHTLSIYCLTGIIFDQLNNFQEIRKTKCPKNLAAYLYTLYDLTVPVMCSVNDADMPILHVLNV